MLAENLERRITAIAIQLRHAEDRTISNIARSAYYRSAIILMCTIVEGLVYELAKKKSKRTNNVITVKEELRKIHLIPRDVFRRKNIVIAKRTQRRVHIDDDDVSFKRLNDFLKRKSIITEQEYEKLDYVRRERNKLHLQGLRNPDIGYTKQKVKKVSEPVDFLTAKLY